MNEQGNMKMTRQLRILDEVKRYTREQIKDGVPFGVQANEIAESLTLERSNVSKELNQLYRAGLVIKLQGKPTLYVHRDIVCQRYPDCFIPVTISRGQTIKDYIHTEQLPNDILPQPQTELETMIGANGSMKQAIRQARAAVSYPPRGLHTLLIGSVGVGKIKFARSMYCYAAAKGKIRPDAEFVTFNCQDYAASPQYLLSQIFGYVKGAMPGSEKGRRGLIESAAGGMLYLDGVDKLPPKAQDMLITLIEKNIFSRLGEASVTRQGDLMIVAATTQRPDSPVISKFIRSVPVRIVLPDIDARGSAEVMEHLFRFFDKEAETIGVAIKIHKDILTCLTAVKHAGNIGEMKSTVKIITSQAYLEFSAENKPSRVMEITYQHLPAGITQSLSGQEAAVAEIVELFSDSRQEYVVFTPGVRTPFFAATPKESKPIVDTFTDKAIRSDVTFEMDDVGSYISHCVSRLRAGGDAQIDALKEMVPEEVYNTLFRTLSGFAEYRCMIQNPSLLYGFLLHVFNIIKRVENQLEIRYRPGADIKITNPKEYAAAQTIRYRLHEAVGIMLPEQELGFIAMYLYLATKWSESSRVALLAVFHGAHVAEAMAEYVNAVCKCSRVSWINFTSQMSYEMLLQDVVQRAKELDQGAGVLLLTDMEPLSALHKHVMSVTGIKAETLCGVSMPVMLAMAYRSMKAGYTIRALLSEVIVPAEISVREESPSHEAGTPFMNRIINEILIKSLTFLNPAKAAHALLGSLDLILSGLQLPYSDEIAIKFIFHCSHMLERVIRAAPLEYVRLKRFVNENSELMLLLEKSLAYPSEIFGIIIPASEFAYIAEIFLPFLKKE
ncbi:sigma 54-interacting transcriptional regulator [Oscillospiraceae bacterium PP1C4]